MATAPLSLAVFGMGLGESIVIRTESNDEAAWAVIDSAQRTYRGAKVNPALELLKSCEAWPDLCVLTHPHLDHTKGFDDIVERARPGATICCVEPLMEPFDELDALYETDDDRANNISATVRAHAAIRARWRRDSTASSPLHHAGPPLRLGQWQLGILHPTEGLAERMATQIAGGHEPNLNDVSAALLLRFGEVDVLFAGDGEAAAWSAVAGRLAPGDLLHTAPIKVPHHGSLEALHPVLIDPLQPALGRQQVVTPFPRSGRLPRFEPGQGAERLCLAAGGFGLTAMPVNLVPRQPSVSLVDVRAALVTEPLVGDADLLFRLEDPPETAWFTEQTKDPHECWALVNLHTDGAATVTFGAHALQVTSN